MGAVSTQYVVRQVFDHLAELADQQGLQQGLVLWRRARGARDPAVGFVLAPPPVNRFYCIYPSDANSMNAMEQEMKGRVPHASHACGKTCRPPDEMHYCSFRDDNLSLALEANANYGFDSRFKYNEVIVDAERMKAALPRSLLGVFYMDEETREQARNMVNSSRPSTLDETTSPLMAFSLTEGFRWVPDFCIFAHLSHTLAPHTNTPLHSCRLGRREGS